MNIPLVLLGTTFIIDFIFIIFPQLWRRSPMRTGIAASLLFLSTIAAASLVAAQPNIFTVLVVVLAAYRALNYTRIALGRMNHHALRSVGVRSVIWLDGLQLIILLTWLARLNVPVGADTLFIIWSVVVLAAGVGALVSTLRNLRKTKLRQITSTEHLTSSQLPTVTVAIPARNETNNLIACLESVIASEYQKLEILALDDNSHMKRTPEIIRSFAHKGVRFLQGTKPRDGWLAKNQAYDLLADEATGEYLLFMGVDVRLTPAAIRELVDHMHVSGKTMLSVLPLRERGPRLKFSLAQAARYMWELAPPRRAFNRPPVLSSLWIIEKKAFLELGGMAAVKRAVIPEAYFAKQLALRDAYGFVRATESLGVTSSKSLPDQRDTALRVRYPALHRHIEFVAILLLSYCLIILAPLALVLGALLGELPALAGIFGGAALLCFALAFAAVTRATKLSSYVFGALAYPAAALQDIAITHASLWGYEFGTVTWKQRNTVGPVMQVSKHLPKV